MSVGAQGGSLRCKGFIQWLRSGIVVLARMVSVKYNLKIKSHIDLQGERWQKLL